MAAPRIALAVVAALSFLAMTHGQVRVRQVTAPYMLSEGPSWDSKHNGLLFVDLSGSTLHFYNPKTRVDRWLTLDGPVAPAIQLADGSLAVGVGQSLLQIHWAASKFDSVLRTPPKVLATVDANKTTQFCDGNIDSKGRLWIGTAGREENQGSVYRFTRNRNGSVDVTTALSPVTISNGLVFNQNETLMFYIDTPTRRVDVFDYNLAEGTIANRRTAFDFAAQNITGVPDGMTMDANGNLWVACNGGGQVIQVDPRSGRLVRKVDIPASQVTALAFGGPRVGCGDTLYVTTARSGLSDAQLLEEPAAGAVFAVTGLGVRRRA